MPIKRLIVSIFSVGMMVLGADGASGQDYPNKPIRILTAEAGGNGDLHARVTAQGLSSSLGSVIVDNRSTTVIAAETVAKATPDGYTLLVTGSAFWVGTLLQKMSYDPVNDFSPISLLSISPLVLVVHPSLPVNSVKDLIALAKSKPGELNYASNAIGAPSHLAAELFKSMAAVNIVRINYKGGSAAPNALLGGEVQMMFGSPAAVAPHVRSGRLKALAVTSAQPSALVPDLPTMAASGLPGYVSQVTTGVFVPARTPEAIIKRLNQETVRFLNISEAKERLLKSGVEAASSSPEQFAAIIKAELISLGKLIKDAGIKLE